MCYLNSSASVGIFTWLDDPNIVIFLLFELFVSLGELDELGVSVVTSFDVKGEGNSNFERVDTHSLVVSADVKEKSLFVRQVIVVIQSVVN